ncbi:MAG: LiaF domain-containing protein [Gemmatimonadaceae bacterium]
MADLRADDYRLGDQLRIGAREENPHQAEQLAEVPASQVMSGVVSFLSSNERKGRWELPRQFRALAVLGNVELDLREAEIGYGLSTIEAVSVFGNIEITIPPDVAVECDGDSLLGSFAVKYHGPASPSAANRDRTVRITGSVYAGNVEVMVKGPDEDMLTKLGRRLGRRSH